MKAWAAFLFVFMVMAGLAGYFYLAGDDVDVSTVPTAVVEKGLFRITLTVTGELEAVDSEVVTAPTAGGSKKITKLAPQGSRVDKGDIIVAFDETDFRKELKEAKNALEVIQTRILQHHASAEVQVGEIDNQLAMAELSLERSRLTLTDSDTVARIEQERAKISVAEANLSVEKLTRNRRLKEQDLGSSLKLLKLEEEKVTSRVIRAKDALENCTVKAPISGLVLLATVWKGSGWGTVEEGDTVWPGKTVLELPDLSALQVVVQVHEVDAGQVALDQVATFKLDAYPGPSFDAKVNLIANLATTIDRGSKIKYFRTVLAVDEPSPEMKPGMTAKVDIQVETLEDVLSIPRESVFEGIEGDIVYKLEGDHFRAQAVVLGSKNHTHIVVEEGLSPEDKIALVDVDSLGEEKGDASKKATDDPAVDAGSGG